MKRCINRLKVTIGFFIVCSVSTSLVAHENQAEIAKVTQSKTLEVQTGSSVDLSHIRMDSFTNIFSESFSALGNRPYTVFGKEYTPLKSAGKYNEVGLASWYGSRFHGRPTANGEIVDMYELSAAHRTLPLPSTMIVTNLNNNLSVTVRINDRGPFVDTDNKVIDLSYAAAKQLDMINEGFAMVEIKRVTIEYESQFDSEPTDKAAANIETPKVSLLPLGVYLQIIEVDSVTDAATFLHAMNQYGFKGFVHALESNETMLMIKTGPYQDADEALRKKFDIDAALNVESRVVFE
jgi:rare lipoprotein A